MSSASLKPWQLKHVSHLCFLPFPSVLFVNLSFVGRIAFEYEKLIQECRTDHPIRSLIIGIPHICHTYHICYKYDVSYMSGSIFQLINFGLHATAWKFQIPKYQEKLLPSNMLFDQSAQNWENVSSSGSKLTFLLFSTLATCCLSNQLLILDKLVNNSNGETIRSWHK